MTGESELADLSPFLRFSREEWSRLRAAVPLTLNQRNLSALQGLGENVSIEEVVEIYLPLARLLNLHSGASRVLYNVTDSFLGNPAAKVPYVIDIAGSVAVGKSTTTRILQSLLSREGPTALEKDEPGRRGYRQQASGPLLKPVA